MSAATPEGILRAVEEQRSRIINVVSVVRCLKFSEEAGELAGALALVELELERILEALEQPGPGRGSADPKPVAVILTDYPADKKVAITKVIRESGGVSGIKEAKELVENLPARIEVVSEEHGELLIGLLAAVGATATLGDSP